MKKFLLSISTTIFLIFFLLSATLMTLSLIADFSPHVRDNPNYSYMTFSGEIETRSFQLEREELYPGSNQKDYVSLSFFDYNNYVNFLNASPSLKIVNSEDYRVEVTTHSDVFDNLVVELDYFQMWKHILNIEFKKECYAELWDNWSPSREYYGLNATLDVFDVTVYAPVSSIYSYASLTLDYEAPRLVSVRTEFHGDNTVANIHGLDKNRLSIICTGTNNITVAGNVKSIDVHAIHNSKIDASALTAETYDFYTSTSVALCDFSYVKYDGRYHINFFGNYGLIWTLVYKDIIYVLPFVWLGLAISRIVKIRRLRR